MAMSGQAHTPMYCCLLSAGDEVLALKRLIQRCQADGERLRESIAVNKARDEFLMSHR